MESYGNLECGIGQWLKAIDICLMIAGPPLPRLKFGGCGGNYICTFISAIALLTVVVRTGSVNGAESHIIF